MRPLSKRRSESWYGYYLRIYVFPGITLVVPAAGVARFADLGMSELEFNEYALWSAGAFALALLTQLRDRNAAP